MREVELRLQRELYRGVLAAVLRLPPRPLPRAGVDLVDDVVDGVGEPRLAALLRPRVAPEALLAVLEVRHDAELLLVPEATGGG